MKKWMIIVSFLMCLLCQFPGVVFGAVVDSDDQQKQELQQEIEDLKAVVKATKKQLKEELEELSSFLKEEKNLLERYALNKISSQEEILRDSILLVEKMIRNQKKIIGLVQEKIEAVASELSRRKKLYNEMSNE